MCLKTVYGLVLFCFPPPPPLPPPPPFPPLLSFCFLSFLAEIKRLMGCFMFSLKGIETSPYSDLLDSWHWTEVADLFAKDACKLLGLSLESPLEVRYFLYRYMKLKLLQNSSFVDWLVVTSRVNLRRKWKLCLIQKLYCL